MNLAGVNYTSKKEREKLHLCDSCILYIKSPMLTDDVYFFTLLVVIPVMGLAMAEVVIISTGDELIIE